MLKRTNGEKIFGVFNGFILILIGIVTLYPLVYVVAGSLSSPDAINTGKVWFFPVDFTWRAYKEVFELDHLLSSFANSVLYMVAGTVISLVLTVCGAYPLSRKSLPGGRGLNLFVTATMWLGAGTIPVYQTFQAYGLLNSRIGFLVGTAVSTYNFIVLRTNYAAIPDSLEEAAKIDGASDFQIMTKIYVPLSTAAMATIALFYATGRWNEYFWPMLLFRDDSKMPLQVFLKKLIVTMTKGLGSADASTTDTVTNALSTENVTYATIVFTIIPMLIVYPWLQKYFVKGVMVGSVKG